MKILVTGGAGFIGTNFILYMIGRYPSCKIINLDKLTYAGNRKNLIHLEGGERYTFVKGDIADRELVNSLCKEGIDLVINFAAESHVDRSIEEPSVFIKTNVLGTQVLLDACQECKIPLFIQISTDEVYGSLGKKGSFKETTPLRPNSPYSASKAGADLLVRAYHHTYRLPAIITRSSNNYGPYQFPEKFIPLMISNALEDKPLPIYGKGLNVRDWIYVEDHCRVLDLILHKGRPGEIYNIGANNEKSNLEVVQNLLEELKKPKSLITFVKDRPGHDFRYAIDSTKIRKELGWAPKYSFGEGLSLTIQWYMENQGWWQEIKSGEYQQYYKRMYLEREGYRD